jgi:hypothetical protein
MLRWKATSSRSLSEKLVPLSAGLHVYIFPLFGEMEEV